MPNGDKVFVSSTCEDLIDLRAELERSLKDMGLTPVMSDRKFSGFDSSQPDHTVQLCLTNLIACKHVIVVLSKRYGEVSRDEKISVTHLEYRTAIDAEKNIYFYVRDRLDADYRAWEANDPGYRPVWAEDPRLFNLIREHTAMPTVGKRRNNWKNTFSTSVDLVDQVHKDLKRESAEALLQTLAEQGGCPEIRITQIFPPLGATIGIPVINLGSISALDPEVRLKQPGNLAPEFFAQLSIPPGESDRYVFSLTAQNLQSKHPVLALFEIKYRIPRGWIIKDTFTIDRTNHASHRGKTLVEPATVVSDFPENPWADS